MNCKKAWGQNFLVIQLDRSFNNKEYKNHRKSVLLDGEISKLPETMEAAQHFQKREELQEENRKLHDIEAELRKRLREIGDTIAVNTNTIYRIGAGQYKKVKKGENLLASLMKIVVGFFSIYKCELCKLYTCGKCCEIIRIKKIPIMCNPDSVKTTEMIKAETNLVHLVDAAFTKFLVVIRCGAPNVMSLSVGGQDFVKQVSFIIHTFISGNVTRMVDKLHVFLEMIRVAIVTICQIGGTFVVNGCGTFL